MDNEENETALNSSGKIFQAIRSGDLKTLKELLKPSLGNLIDANDNEKETPQDDYTLLSLRAEEELVVRRPSNSSEVGVIF